MAEFKRLRAYVAAAKDLEDGFAQLVRLSTGDADLWVKALSETELKGMKGVGRGLGAGIVGYMLVLWGMAGWSLADDMDPSGNNMGLFNFLGP